MNHVKELIFQTWPPVGKMPAVVRQSPDPWLQGSLHHLLCWPTGHYNAAAKLIHLKVSFCVDSSKSLDADPLLFHFQCGVHVVKSWLRMLLNSGVTQVLRLVSNVNCGPEMSCWATNSQFNWKLEEYSRDVSVHAESIDAVVIRPGSSKNDKKGGTKKRWKGSLGHLQGLWEYIGFDSPPAWVEIHIRGLSVWSMSRGITTSGEVSWQTGPGHWMVLRTSLHSYINRIKTSNWGLLASFEHSGRRTRKMSPGWWENLESGSSNPSISTKSRDARQSLKGGIIAILRHKLMDYINSNAKATSNTLR